MVLTQVRFSLHTHGGTGTPQAHTQPLTICRSAKNTFLSHGGQTFVAGTPLEATGSFHSVGPTERGVQKPPVPELQMEVRSACHHPHLPSTEPWPLEGQAAGEGRRGRRWERAVMTYRLQPVALATRCCHWLAYPLMLLLL